MTLSNLPSVRQKPAKRVGRGPGSGKGKTGGRGMNGQKSRAGNKFYQGFEGGKTPLKKTTPKLKGFSSRHVKDYQIVNLMQLEKLASSGEITKLALVEAGIIDSTDSRVKVLGKGEVSSALVVHADLASKQVIEKIENAGGKVHLPQQ